jgi:16S rRNA (adenine1518-N6/adenine1519-N6)-dimethyltransferase
MTPTETRQLLAAKGIRLTKSLGQSFLHDANQLRRIVAAAELTKADRVLEIGPGLGPLTELLVEQAGEVLAIEKDARLVQVLKERFNLGQASHLPMNIGSQEGPLSLSRSPSEGERSPSGPVRGLAGSKQERAGVGFLSPTRTDELKGTGSTPGLQLLHDDALEYLRREARDWSGWKLVANLPYSVASPILVELAQGGHGPQRMVATLQLEVAKRLSATPGNPDYGLLTLLVQLDYQSQSWFKIPASCFFPEPDVDSACVCLVRREQRLLGPETRDTFARIVKRSFCQRRKMMFKLLKADWPEARLATEFERLKLPPQVRAEEVSPEQFARMAQALFQNPK